tara:strand:+ start:207 stop:377 length:171 start_codon:yes stop_codon:yes gene_type:complete
MSNTQQKTPNQKQITINQKDYDTLTKAFFILLENDFELNLSTDFTKSILDFNSKIQ